MHGIEITAVEDGRDVHMLGLFLRSRPTPALAAFLDAQRADRIRRVRDIARGCASLGCPIDVDALLGLGAAHAGRSIGRPQIADALVAAGHARDRNDAFDRLLGAGSPAFIPRRGPTPDEVIAIVGKSRRHRVARPPRADEDDGIIPRLVAAGLTALEVRHSDHDAATEQHYRALAATLGLAASGGSDFHGDSGHRAAALGDVTLPAEDFAALESRAGARDTSADGPLVRDHGRRARATAALRPLRIQSLAIAPGERVADRPASTPRPRKCWSTW